MMRKLIFLFSLSLIFLQNVSASHLAGGHLDYECIAENTYVVTLTFFRDCSGLEIDPDDDGPILWLESNSCSYPCTDIGVLEYDDHENVDYGCGNTCLVGGLPGFQKYTYKKTVVLPSACADWKLSISISARNVTTFADGGNYVNYILINNTAGICNNSPKFNDLGVWIGCNNTATIFNNNYTEIDGDNLVFEIINPLKLNGLGSVCSDGHEDLTYAPGLSMNNPMPMIAPMSINASTGQISMTPTAVGTSYFAVKVSEYRSGILISESIRDGEIIIDNCEPTGEVTFNPWFGSSGDSLTVVPNSEDCYAILITSENVITEVHPTNLPVDLFTFESEGLGTTAVIFKICPIWDAFDDFCDLQTFNPEVHVSTVGEDCFTDGGSISHNYIFIIEEIDWCPDYRFFTNRGPEYPLLPLPAIARATQAIYIGDEMPVFSLIDPSDMGAVQGSGDHFFEAPEIIISCTGGGSDCVDFVVDGSHIITFKYGSPLCSPLCPQIPLTVNVSEIFECGNERITAEVITGEPPYTFYWYNADSEIIGVDSVLNVHSLVKDSTWVGEVPYTLLVEDISGAIFTHEDFLHGTERFYRNIQDNMYLFTHPDWPMYEDSTYMYDANLWCYWNAPFFVFDGINDDPPYYGATEIDMYIVDRYGSIQYHYFKSIENTNDWSFDNKEVTWDGTTNNTGDPDDCVDGAGEVLGDYTLYARNCFTFVHKEIDIVGLFACLTDDWSDSIIVANLPNNVGEGVIYNGIRFIRRNPKDFASDEQISKLLVLYPNPADNVININGINIEIFSIQIIDSHGREIINLGNSKVVDVSSLAIGFYTVRINTSAGIEEKKLIIE